MPAILRGMSETLANVAMFDHLANGCQANKDTPTTSSVELGQEASS